jgi:YD repeat-containing protein
MGICSHDEFIASLTIDRAKNEGQRAAKNRTTLCSVDGRLVALRLHSSKAGVSYTYQDTAHKHAVTHLGGVQKYWYDANGNMTTRISGSNTYTLGYDTENHLITVSGAATATFVYDADGVRVRGTSGGVTTRYIGSYYEWTSAGSTSYYYAGSCQAPCKLWQ